MRRDTIAAMILSLPTLDIEGIIDPSQKILTTKNAHFALIVSSNSWMQGPIVLIYGQIFGSYEATAPDIIWNPP